MTITIRDSQAALLSVKEVAMQLEACGALHMEADERMGEAVLEDGELVIPILYDEPMDVRIDGCRKRDEAFSLSAIRRAFTEADYLLWATDEDGDDVLVCF